MEGPSPQTHFLEDFDFPFMCLFLSSLESPRAARSPPNSPGKSPCQQAITCPNPYPANGPTERIFRTEVVGSLERVTRCTTVWSVLRCGRTPLPPWNDGTLEKWSTRYRNRKALIYCFFPGPSLQYCITPILPSGWYGGKSGHESGSCGRRHRPCFSVERLRPFQ